ncbi:MAG: MBL fold metallo-hydrolase [Crenarchaeota archaeon]|nr:MBL fold metallo-hydrolase [Thermoproteota archaeon]MCR8455029.1 MBL fold metallo-hydrolase [Thermoproteota archaeon]MCR8500901.1 MBL fold metallo-hydrolase [Thermoproteota archaeon]
MLLVPKIYKVLGNKGCNSYVIEGLEGLAIIDVGSLGSEKGILKYIEAQLNASPEDVAYVLLTHARRQNAEATLDLLSSCPNAKVVIHENELDYFKRVSLVVDIEDLVVVRTDVLKLDFLEIMHMPGYTPGSIAIKFEKSIFVGGSLYINARGEITLPMQMYDRKLLLESLKKLLDFRFENMFPAYGRYIIGNAGLKFQKFMAQFT